MEEFHAVVLGAGGVGKSALTLRFIRNQFVDLYDPTIEESFQKILRVDDRQIALDVLDTAGAEQFTAISEFYLRGADGFILVFSLTSAYSLNELETLRQQVIRVKGFEMKHIPMIAVGTKSDLDEEREVLPAAIRKKREEWKIPFLETSAKRGIGVNEAFHDLVRQMMIQRDRKRRPRTSAGRSHRSSEATNGGGHHRSSRKKKGSGSCTIM